MTVIALIAAGPVSAQKPSPHDNVEEQTERAIKEGVQTVLRALESMFKSVPQYDLPEVMENGDIILRRKRPNDVKDSGDTGST